MATRQEIARDLTLAWIAKQHDLKPESVVETYTTILNAIPSNGREEV